MENKTKIIGGIIGGLVLICVLFVMGYMIKQQRDIINALQQNSDQQRLLKDDITVVKGSLLSKDEFNKKLEALGMDMSVLKADLKATGASVTSILEITNHTPGAIGTNVPVTGFYPRLPIDSSQPGPATGNPPIPNPAPVVPCEPSSNQKCYPDTYGYFEKIPYLRLNEPTKDIKVQVPIGEVSFDVTKQAPWSYKILPRDYSTSVAIATDAVGRKTAYAKMTIKVDNKTYSLPETQVQFNELLPTKQFYWFNPRILFGIDLGYSTKPGLAYGPTLQVFTTTYGQYKFKPDWFILGLGVNYDIHNSSYNLAVSPFFYNIAGTSSIFQNINVGPTITMDIKGNIAILGGVRLSL